MASFEVGGWSTSLDSMLDGYIDDRMNDKAPSIVAREFKEDPLAFMAVVQAKNNDQFHFMR